MPRAKMSAVLMIVVWLLGTFFWWGLAFYPASGNEPEWLSVARSVCFGAPKMGLPDAGGWLILVLGPLSFLAAGLSAWPRELESAVRALLRAPVGRLVVVFGLAALLVEGVWVAKKIDQVRRVAAVTYENPSSEDLPTNYPRSAKKGPDIELLDQLGQKFRFSDHAHEIHLVTFAYAHCDSVCPVLVRQVLDVGKAFPRGVRVVAITLDPWRDTPSSLPGLAKSWGFGDRAHLLSGPVQDVTAALTQFAVPYERDERDGDVKHPALVYVMAPGGRITYTFNNAPEKWLRQAVERIASENGSLLSASR